MNSFLAYDLQLSLTVFIVDVTQSGVYKHKWMLNPNRFNAIRFSWMWCYYFVVILKIIQIYLELTEKINSTVCFVL